MIESYPKYVPGIPIKRNNPCVDPQQSPKPHIVKALRVIEENGKQTVVGEYELRPSTDYPEYDYLIRMFIKELGLKIETI